MQAAKKKESEIAIVEHGLPLTEDDLAALARAANLSLSEERIRLLLPLLNRELSLFATMDELDLGDAEPQIAFLVPRPARKETP